MNNYAPHKAKVAVVGSGIVGMTQAYVLANAGIKTLVFGLKKKAGMGSLAAMGIVSSKGHCIPRKSDFAFKLYGQQKLFSFCSELEEASCIPITIQMGVFEPFVDETTRDKIVNRAFYKKNMELLNIVELSSEKSLLNHHFKNQSFCSSFFYPQDYWLDTNAMLGALQKVLQEHPNIQVVDKLVKTCGITDDKQWKIKTKDFQEYEATDLVVATGPNTECFLKDAVGLQCSAISEVSGFRLHSPYAGPNKPLSALFGKNSLVINNRQLLYGSGKTPAAEPPSSKEVLNYIQELKELGLVAPIPEKIVETCWGSRALSLDRLPILGPIDFRGKALYLNTAHYKNGFQLAYPSAELLLSYFQDSVDGDSLSLFKKAFHPKRQKLASSFC